MSTTYKMITLVGTSPDSYDEATRNAVADAGRTLRDLCWFEVKEMRGRIADGAVVEYQVKLDVGIRVEGS
jgi:flavin-binding protein dodecin